MIFEQVEQNDKVHNLAELKDEIKSKFHTCKNKLKRKLAPHDFHAE